MKDIKDKGIEELKEELSGSEKKLYEELKLLIKSYKECAGDLEIMKKSSKEYYESLIAYCKIMHICYLAENGKHD